MARREGRVSCCDCGCCTTCCDFGGAVLPPLDTRAVVDTLVAAAAAWLRSGVDGALQNYISIANIASRENKLSGRGMGIFFSYFRNN